MYHITVRFWHHTIAEHFHFLVGKVVMSETVLLKCRKWKHILKCLIISAFSESLSSGSILDPLNDIDTSTAFYLTCFGTVKHSCEHSWYGVLSIPVRSRRFQFSGWRSRVGSRNPREIGMGVPNILGFVTRGYRKMGVPIFCDTGLNVPCKRGLSRHSGAETKNGEGLGAFIT